MKKVLTAIFLLFSTPVLAGQIIPLEDAKGREMLINATSSAEMWQVFSRIVSVAEAQRTQQMCGVFSLLIAENSLGIPGETYVDDWYPFNLMNFHTLMNRAFLQVKPPNKINKDGLTLDELARAANTNMWITANAYHVTSEMGYKSFEQLLITAMQDPSNRIIINYDRWTLGQTVVGEKGKVGHHSNLAAYDPTTKSVLIVDTARYKNSNTPGGLNDNSGKPVWVKISDLFDALNTEDDSVHLNRGFIVVHKKDGVSYSWAKMEQAWNQFWGNSYNLMAEAVSWVF